MNDLFEPFLLSDLVNNLEKLKERKRFFNNEFDLNLSEYELNQNTKYYHYLIYAAMKSRGAGKNELLSLCDKYGYDFLLVLEGIPIKFLWKYKDKINWDEVSSLLPLRSEILINFGNRLNWNDVIMFQDFNTDLLSQNENHIDFSILTRRVEVERLLPKKAKLNLCKNELLELFKFSVENKFRDIG